MAIEVLRQDEGWRILLYEEADRARFDAFVASAPRGNPLQRWSWGEVKRGDGWVPIRLGIEREGVVRATVSMVERRLAGRLPVWWAHRGPVVEPDGPDAARLWRGVRQLGRRSGAVFLRCDPEWAEVEAASMVGHGARRVPLRDGWAMGAIEPVRVWRLSLSGGEEAVFARFAASTRNDIRRARRKGVSVRQGRHEDLDVFYRFERDVAVRKGFAVRSRAFFERLWRAWDGPDSCFLVAQREGEAVGGLWSVACGPGVWGQFVAADHARRHLLAGSLLYWETMRWAIARGSAFFDTGGVDHRDDREDRVRAFKKGFGPGDTRFGGEYDVVFRPALYGALRLGEEAFWRLNDWRGARRLAARSHKAATPAGT